MEHDIDIDIDKASPTLEECLANAKVSIQEFAPAPQWVYEACLDKARLPRGSLLSTLLRRSDGMLLDDGWFRVLGTSPKACGRSLDEWNKADGWRRAWGPGAAGMLCFADDPVGNQFAINLGEERRGNWQVHLGWIDTMKWTNLDLTFGQWLEAVIQGHGNKWYDPDLIKTLRGLAKTVKVESSECWSLDPPISAGGSWTASKISRLRAGELMGKAAALRHAAADRA